MAGKHHGDRTSPVVTIPPGQFGGSELRCSPYLNSEEEVQWHVDEPIEEGDPVTGGHHGRPFPMDLSRKFLGDDLGVKKYLLSVWIHRDWTMLEISSGYNHQRWNSMLWDKINMDDIPLIPLWGNVSTQAVGLFSAKSLEFSPTDGVRTLVGLNIGVPLNPLVTLCCAFPLKIAEKWSLYRKEPSKLVRDPTDSMWEIQFVAPTSSPCLNWQRPASDSVSLDVRYLAQNCIQKWPAPGNQLQTWRCFSIKFDDFPSH
jgi:hypothetical protein